MRTLNNVVLVLVAFLVAFGSVVPVDASGMLERVNAPVVQDGIMNDAVRLAMGTTATATAQTSTTAPATTTAESSSSSSRSCGGCEAAMWIGALMLGGGAWAALEAGGDDDDIFGAALVDDHSGGSTGAQWTAGIGFILLMGGWMANP